MQWIIGFTIILIVVGTIFGLALINFSPDVNAAEARQLDAEIGYQQSLNEQELRLVAAQTEAEIREIEREQEAAEQRAAAEQAYTQALNQKKLAAYENFMNASIILMMIIVITLTAIGGLRFSKRAVNEVRSVRAQTKSPHPNSSRLPPSIKPIVMRYQANPDYDELEQLIQYKRGELRELMIQASLLCKVGHQSKPAYHKLREQIKAKQDELNELYKQATMSHHIDIARNPASISKKQRDRMPTAG